MRRLFASDRLGGWRNASATRPCIDGGDSRAAARALTSTVRRLSKEKRSTETPFRSTPNALRRALDVYNNPFA